MSKKNKPRLVGEKVDIDEEDLLRGQQSVSATTGMLAIIIDDWRRADAFLTERGYESIDENGLFVPMSERIREMSEDEQEA